MALAPGSPAIGHGNCPDFSPALDQRGLPRPGAGETGCDAGADEFQNGTSASVSCPATAVDQATPCTATVTAPSGEAPAPSGSVSLTSNGAGTFAAGGSCTLAPTSPGATSASCAVAYTPSAQGSQVITLAYGGDSVYRGAGASTTLAITLRPVAVAVTCTPNPAGFGAPTTCAATVTDQAGAGAGPPTGTVTFSGTAGSFGSTSTCMLSGAGATASCDRAADAERGGTQDRSRRRTAAMRCMLRITGIDATDRQDRSAGQRMSVLCAPGTVAPGASTTCKATVGAVTGRVAARPTGSVAFSVTGASRPSEAGARARCARRAPRRRAR